LITGSRDRRDDEKNDKNSAQPGKKFHLYYFLKDTLLSTDTKWQSVFKKNMINPLRSIRTNSLPEYHLLSDSCTYKTEGLGCQYSIDTGDVVK
jgi:hypothetical protein